MTEIEEMTEDDEDTISATLMTASIKELLASSNTATIDITITCLFGYLEELLSSVLLL